MIYNKIYSFFIRVIANKITNIDWYIRPLVAFISNIK